MNITTDTHTLFWFTTENKSLSRRAKKTLERAEIVYIPTIVLLELFHLMRKYSRTKYFPIMISQIQNDKKYIIISLDLACVLDVVNLPFEIELHDSIIVSTSQSLNAPLVTKDEIIQKVYKNTIW